MEREEKLKALDAAMAQVEKQFGKKDRQIETSLIEEFSYPKLGPGELWDVTAAEVVRMGGTILKNTKYFVTKRYPRVLTYKESSLSQ